MNYREATSLKIDGKYFEKDDLISFSNTQIKNPEIPGWQKSILNFIHNWLDNSDYIIVKTSGSTGVPKSIKLKKQYMLNSVLKTGAFLGLKKNDSALLCLSADYIAGKMMIVRSTVLGLDLTMVEPSGNPLKNMDEKYDFAAMVPMQVFHILLEEGGEQKLNKINNLIIGGAPVSTALKEKIKSLTNNTFSTYGMTETITHIAMERLNGKNADGLLHLLPGIKISTDDEKRINIYAHGISDAVVKTNDLAEINEDGSFKILGRFDNMIISGGINIIPETVEKKIEKFIDQRYIISAIYDEKLGEKLVLIIEGDKWPAEKIKVLQHLMAEILHPYENPKQIIFISKLPETASQKIDRPGVRE